MELSSFWLLVACFICAAAVALIYQLDRFRQYSSQEIKELVSFIWASFRETLRSKPAGGLLRELEQKREALHDLAQMSRSSRLLLLQLTSLVLTYDSRLLLRRVLGETKNPIDPATSKLIKVFVRGLSFHLLRQQADRSFDALARLTLLCASPAGRFSTAKDKYLRLGIARSDLAGLIGEGDELRQLRSEFVVAAVPFITDALRTYSPSEVNTFLAHWRDRAVNARDPHLFLLLTVMANNLRGLVVLSRHRTPASREAMTSLRAWADAIVAVDLEGQCTAAFDLLEILKRFDTRLARLPRASVA